MMDGQANIKCNFRASFSVAHQLNSAQCHLIFEASRSDAITHTHTHTRRDSSERVISSSDRPLPTQHTTNKTDEHPCCQRDSNPQSQQSSGPRRTPETTRPPGSPILVLLTHTCPKRRYAAVRCPHYSISTPYTYVIYHQQRL